MNDLLLSVTGYLLSTGKKTRIKSRLISLFFFRFASLLQRCTEVCCRVSGSDAAEEIRMVRHESPT